MAQPQISGSVYVVDQNETATLTQKSPNGAGQFFHTIVCGKTAVVVTVKGGGIFENVGANSGNGTHLDSDGKVLGATHDAGFYEAVSTQGVAIDMAPGEVLCGRFTSVAVANTANAEVHVYR